MILKEALSVSTLCASVFIFTPGSSALLGHPRCGLSIWLSPLVIFSTLFWAYAHVFHEKTDKTRKYSKSAIFVWKENGRQWLLDAQSINTERVSVTKKELSFTQWGHFTFISSDLVVLHHIAVEFGPTAQLQVVIFIMEHLTIWS